MWGTSLHASYENKCWFKNSSAGWTRNDHFISGGRGCGAVSLVGIGAMALALKERNIKTEDELQDMKHPDLRKELEDQLEWFAVPRTEMQKMEDTDLVAFACRMVQAEGGSRSF